VGGRGDLSPGPRGARPHGTGGGGGGRPARFGGGGGHRGGRDRGGKKTPGGFFYRLGKWGGGAGPTVDCFRGALKGAKKNSPGDENGNRIRVPRGGFPRASLPFVFRRGQKPIKTGGGGYPRAGGKNKDLHPTGGGASDGHFSGAFGLYFGPQFFKYPNRARGREHPPMNVGRPNHGDCQWGGVFFQGVGDPGGLPKWWAPGAGGAVTVHARSPGRHGGGPGSLFPRFVKKKHPLWVGLQKKTTGKGGTQKAPNWGGTRFFWLFGLGFWGPGFFGASITKGAVFFHTQKGPGGGGGLFARGGWGKKTACSETLTPPGWGEVCFRLFGFWMPVCFSRSEKNLRAKALTGFFCGGGRCFLPVGFGGGGAFFLEGRGALNFFRAGPSAGGGPAPRAGGAGGWWGRGPGGPGPLQFGFGPENRFRFGGGGAQGGGNWFRNGNRGRKPGAPNFFRDGLIEETRGGKKWASGPGPIKTGIFATCQTGSRRREYFYGGPIFILGWFRGAGGAPPGENVCGTRAWGNQKNGGRAGEKRGGGGRLVNVGRPGVIEKKTRGAPRRYFRANF